MEKGWREEKRGEKKGKEEARRKGERKAREGKSKEGSEVRREGGRGGYKIGSRKEAHWKVSQMAIDFLGLG